MQILQTNMIIFLTHVNYIYSPGYTFAIYETNLTK